MIIAVIKIFKLLKTVVITMVKTCGSCLDL